MADSPSIETRTADLVARGRKACEGVIDYWGNWDDISPDLPKMLDTVDMLNITLARCQEALVEQTSTTPTYHTSDAETNLSALNESVSELERKLEKCRGLLAPVLEVKPSRPVLPQSRKMLYPFRRSTLLRFCEIAENVYDDVNTIISGLQLWVLTLDTHLGVRFLTCYRSVGEVVDQEMSEQDVSSSTSTDYARLVRQLVQSGVDLGALDSSKYSALHYAVPMPGGWAMDILLGAGADPNLAGPESATPLMLAMHATPFASLESYTQRLIHAGADVQKRDGLGWTVLHHAALGARAYAGSNDKARTLRKIDADKGAERYSREAIVASISHLLQSGAPVNSGNQHEQTPLHLCAYHGNMVVAQQLLDAGAKVNAVNKAGSTALHVAARVGDLQMTRLLLDRGSDATAVNLDGKTALHGAARILQSLDRFNALCEMFAAAGLPQEAVAAAKRCKDLRERLRMADWAREAGWGEEQADFWLSDDDGPVTECCSEDREQGLGRPQGWREIPMDKTLSRMECVQLDEVY
jgi:ankyrin repeat protein